MIKINWWLKSIDDYSQLTFKWNTFTDGQTNWQMNEWMEYPMSSVAFATEIQCPNFWIKRLLIWT